MTILRLAVDHSDMLRNPLVRWGIGLWGAAIVAGVAYFYLSGTVQLVAYGIAALDAIVTPLILKQSVKE